METNDIKSKIYTIRGYKVMLDFDLAELYGIETRALNQAVTRNLKKFPIDFMFKLNPNEWENMISQFVISSQKKRKKTSEPIAFTEHGITMLASVIKSDKAINMNIAIVRAFIAMRKIIFDVNQISNQMEIIKTKIGEHDAQLNEIYTALENLLDKQIEQKNWEDRDRIGFKH